MFNIGNTITYIFSAKIQYYINNIGPCYFTVVSIWPKSYHDTAPQGTVLRQNPDTNLRTHKKN